MGYKIAIALIAIVCVLASVSFTTEAFAACSDEPGPNVDWSGCDKPSSNFIGTDIHGMKFDNAILDGSQFTGANASSASFIGASLIITFWEGANISGSDFTNADLTLATLSLVGSTNFGCPNNCANFEGIEMANSSWRGLPVSFTNLQNANFHGATFSVPGLAWFDWSDARGANFSDIHFPQPNICVDIGAEFCTYQIFMQNSILDNITFENSRIAGTFLFADMEGANFKKADLQGSNFDFDIKLIPIGFAGLKNADFSGANVSGISFTACIAPNSKWVGAIANNAIFNACDLTNADFRAAHLNGAQFLVFAGISGADFSAASVQGAHFTGCIAFDSKWRNLSNADGAFFNSCNLKRADFTGANLQNANLLGFVSVEEATFSGANISNANFDSCIAKNTTWGTNDVLHPTIARDTIFNHCNQTNASFKYVDITSADFLTSSTEVIGNKNCKPLSGNDGIGSDFCEDTIAPEWFSALPQSREITAVHPDPVTITFVKPAAFDFIDGNRPTTCNFPESFEQEIGTTVTIECSTSDTRGNERVHSFTSTIIIPDRDGDGIMDVVDTLPDEVSDFINDNSGDDFDRDGTPNNEDPDSQDPCNPDFAVEACVDKDFDGFLDDPVPDDPCIPNDLIIPCADSDMDGIFPDPAPDDPCIPSESAQACNDFDLDGTSNNIDPAPDDPCIPNPFSNQCFLLGFDSDLDLIPNGVDPAPDDPCIPNESAQACDDFDLDGTPNEFDPAPDDPCIPNDSGFACTFGDSDKDGIPNGEDPAPNDPCSPDPINPACDSDLDGFSDIDDPAPDNPCIPIPSPACIDSDLDGTPNESDPAPEDPCIPNDSGQACLDFNFDSDGDGVPNGEDPAPDDPCNPNPSAVSCLDQDFDGFLDDDPELDNPCIPDSSAQSCIDSDFDLIPNEEDPAPDDPCIPFPSLACIFGDSDKDGTLNDADPAPNNPCNPNPSAVSCLDPDLDGFLGDPAPDDPCIPDNKAEACLDLLVPTTGTITSRGDQGLTVWQDLDPIEGILIDTLISGGDAPAVVNLCDDSANASFDANERAIATCGSVTIEVLKGTVFTDFVNDGFAVTSDITTDGILSYEKENLKICNLGLEPAVVIVGRKVITIPPGECFSFAKNRGNNNWNTRPTFGNSHETFKPLVDNGFRFNTEQFTITDNHHTDFVEQPIEIGQINSFSATVYASKGLKVQEFLFGIPNIGESHLAELGIEVWYDIDGEIEDIVVVQKSDVIDADTISVTHEKKKCQLIDEESLCDTTTVSMIFLESLKDKVMAIKAIDWKNRDHRTYLNDGFGIFGESLNPMNTKMIPSNVKNQGILKVTQLEKYSPYWVSDDGRTFAMNSFGSFKEIDKSFERFQDTGTAYTRVHSGFGGVMAYELKRATNVFDSSNLISELPDSFSYLYPESGKRITDEMKQEMLLQEEIAKQILEQQDKQDRHY